VRATRSRDGPWQHRDAQHVVMSRASFLGDQDDLVEGLLDGEERGHGDVARAEEGRLGAGTVLGRPSGPFVRCGTRPHRRGREPAGASRSVEAISVCSPAEVIGRHSTPPRVRRRMDHRQRLHHGRRRHRLLLLRQARTAITAVHGRFTTKDREPNAMPASTIITLKTASRYRPSASVLHAAAGLGQRSEDQPDARTRRSNGSGAPRRQRRSRL
jgi:hypothetical protein